MTIGLNLDNTIVLNREAIMAPNLCDRLTEKDLDQIGALVWRGYDNDLHSRSAWEDRNEAGMDLAMQISKEKSFPWPGCANIIFPLITIAGLQFSSRSYQNIIQGTDIVRYRVIGEDPKAELWDRAKRISEHMSWQVLEEDKGWEEQHDRMLIHLSIVGIAVVKSFFRSKARHSVSELVTARDFVINYWAKSVDEVPRKTHVIAMQRNEIYEKVVADETFRDVLDEDWFNVIPKPTIQTSQVRSDERSGATPPLPDEDTPLKVLEQHRNLDLDDDGYAEPYIVTVEERSKKVLRIVSRVDDEVQVERKGKKIARITPSEYFTKFSFIPAPDGSFYDVGFGVLVGPLNEGVNTGINQLLDAGTMSNSSGGFLGRGAKIRGGVAAMAPWEWKRVDSTGDDLRKSLVPLPVREPSMVLFQLISLLVNYTDRLAGTTDMMVGINPGQNTPAETSRNMLEQGMQVYTSIFKRIWRSFKDEFKKRHALNGRYLPSKFKFGSEGQYVRREDYQSDPEAVVPVADPNITSAGMRFAQAQSIRQASMEVDGYDRVEVERNFLRAMRVEGIAKMYPGPGKVPPQPNPQAEVEKLKAQAQQMKLDHERWMFCKELMEERRLNSAKILQLEAAAYAAVQGVEADATRVKAEGFKMAIESLMMHNQMVNERIAALMGDGGGKSEQSAGAQPPGPGQPGEPEPGGVPALAGAPGDAGLPPAPEELAGGPEGSMGGEPVPEPGGELEGAGAGGDIEEAA